MDYLYEMSLNPQLELFRRGRVLITMMSACVCMLNQVIRYSENRSILKAKYDDYEIKCIAASRNFIAQAICINCVNLMSILIV